MIDSDISHEDFMLMINEEQTIFRLKESIREKDDKVIDNEQARQW